MELPALIPCPFCGSIGLRFESHSLQQGYISCDQCGAQGPTGRLDYDNPPDPQTAAIEAWNRRS